MKIIEAGNTRALNRVLARGRTSDRALERRVAAIVERVRRGRRRGARPLRAEVRRPGSADRGVARRDAQRRGDGAARRAARDRAAPPGTSHASRSGRSRSTGTSAYRPAWSVEQRVEPLGRVGCYVPGGRFPLPSSLLMTAVPARVAGVPRSDRRVPAARAGRDGRGARGRRHAAVPRRRRARASPRWRTARRRSRGSTRSSGPGNRYVAAAKALVSADCAIDFYAGPTEIVIVAGRRRTDAYPPSGSPPTSSRRPNTIRTRDRSSSPGTRRLAARVAKLVAARAAGRADRPAVARRARRDLIVGAPPTKRWRWPTRSRPSTWSSIASALLRAADHGGRGVRRPVHARRRPATTRPDRITCCRRRARRGSAAACRAADFVRVMAVQRLTRAGLAALAPTIVAAGARRGAARPCRVDRHPSAEIQSVRVMTDYDKPPELYDGLRLHQNENTGGCSPRVLEALAGSRRRSDRCLPAVLARGRRVRPPLRRRARMAGADQRARRRHHGAADRQICGRRPASGVPEAIVPEPAFEIFEFDAAVAGGRPVRVAPRPDFSFPLDEVLAAITARTRVVFVTNPNNPTGTRLSTTDVKDDRAATAGRAPSSSSTKPTPTSPRGRPSSRARDRFRMSSSAARSRRPTGWPGFGIGAVIGVPETLDADPAGDRRSTASTSRRSSPSQAALEDPAFIQDYLRQVRESKALVYAPAIVSGCTTGRATPTSCWSGSATRAADRRRRGRARHLPARPLERAWLRRLHPDHDRNRRAHATGLAVLEEVLCVAR